MCQFLEDITNQPKVLEDTYQLYCTSCADRLDPLVTWRKENPTAPIIFTGMGSSYYAPQAVTPLLSRNGAFAVVLEAGELYHYGSGGIPPHSLIFAISQSGESAETKKVVETYSGKYPIVAVTNNEESSMAQGADRILPLVAGAEAPASTKTFVSSILVLHLAAKTLLGQDITASAEIETVISGLKALIPELKANIDAYLEFLGGISALQIIGRGPSLPSVYHGALIMKETNAARAEGMAAGTFRHGPLELAGPGHRAIVMAPSGLTCDLNLNLAQEMAEYGSKVLLLTDQKVASHRNLQVVPMPSVAEDLSAMVYIVPLELLAWNAAIRNGWTPGVPRRVGKVTTRE